MPKSKTWLPECFKTKPARCVIVLVGRRQRRAPDGRQHERVTLGYAMVHLAEAFIYNDNRNLVLGDVDQLRDVEAALLGLGNTRR